MSYIKMASFSALIDKALNCLVREITYHNQIIFVSFQKNWCSKFKFSHIFGKM